MAIPQMIGFPVDVITYPCSKYKFSWSLLVKEDNQFIFDKYAHDSCFIVLRCGTGTIVTAVFVKSQQWISKKLLIHSQTSTV